MSFLSRRSAREEEVSEYQYTANHLRTVSDLLGRFGACLARQAGIHYDGAEWKRTKDGNLHVLQLQFRDPASPARWVRIFLVRLGFVVATKISPVSSSSPSARRIGINSG